MIVDCKWNSISISPDGMFHAFSKESNCWLDSTGTCLYLLPKCNFIAVGTYSYTVPGDGLVGCPNDYARHGYIDKNGKTIIPFQYQDANTFKNGIAWVKYKGKYGVINTSGDFVINPIFDAGYDFNNGVACVKKNKKLGFIDLSGNFVIDPIFDDCGIDLVDFTPASIDGQMGYINKSGDFVIEPAYKHAEYFEGDFAFVEDFNEKWGLIDKKGHIVVEPCFSSISAPQFYTVAKQ